MNTALIAMIALWIGIGLGYWVGWNRAEHPGKVEGEASRLWSKLFKTKEKP